LDCDIHIFAGKSPVIATMLSTNMKEGLEKKITMDFEPQIVKVFLSYIYKGAVQEDELKCYALDLLQMGQMYDIGRLFEFCENFIVSNIDSDNVRDVYKVAKLMESENLIEGCKAYFKR